MKQYIGISDGDVKQEPEDILVKFSRFHADAIVATELIIPIDSAHVMIVVCDGMWARKGLRCTITVFPNDSGGGGWIRIGCYSYNWPTILSNTDN